MNLYLLNGDYLTAATRSGMIYVELDNIANQPVKRIMIPTVSGVSWGDIALDEKDNLYICDILNNRVRMRDANTDIISTRSCKRLLPAISDADTSATKSPWLS